MALKVQRASLALLLIVTVCAQAFGLHQFVPTRTRRAQQQHQVAQHRSVKRRAHLRRLRWNPLFRPSHESLLLQNAEIDRMDLPRIHDDAELQQLVASGDLVPIDESESLRIEHRLDPARRYCRPWTRDFLEDFSQAYYNQFHTQIQVNSAVRTVLVQKKLRRHNRNAAPIDGDTASSHLAGITVDVQRRGMTRQQVKWVEQYLLPLKQQGYVEPEEERHQWVFHIAVSGRYADLHAPKTVATEEHDEAPDLSLVDLPPQRVSDLFIRNR